LSGQNLGGLTLTPGVYHFDSSAALSGTLTLDAQGNPDVRFDFQIGSTLITATDSAVQLINGAEDDNVYFQVGSSATIGTDTAFQGNILADQSITVTTGASMLEGRPLALVGDTLNYFTIVFEDRLPAMNQN
jgi:Ice-binding-like